MESSWPFQKPALASVSQADLPSGPVAKLGRPPRPGQTDGHNGLISEGPPAGHRPNQPAGTEQSHRQVL